MFMDVVEGTCRWVQNHNVVPNDTRFKHAFCGLIVVRVWLQIKAVLWLLPGCSVQTAGP